ncbi:dihydrodipicolinate synthase family protein [Nakamurella lactea]|uniref:dihydrodipicolinate synthase family protein n=1 Tax=Nakamurella lactea TaxID=459515 RepID=UPI001B7F7F09|nr:dihydrodipicolinate synthase family protein [Nakamurella lactea]
MSECRPIQGVIPVVQTPFTADGDIDEGALVKELAWIKSQQVAGYATGMVSDLLRLEGDERRQLSEIVVDAARTWGLLSVISAGAESTKTAIGRARHAEELGADAIMLNPPVTVTLDDAGLRQYFCNVIDSVRIPVVVQDASGYVGRSIPIALQTELLDRFGDQVYFKPEAQPIGPRLTLLREATDGRARVFEGSGGIALIDSYQRGIVGTMPGSEVCWAIQAMWDALCDGNVDRAYTISGPLSCMLSMQTAIDVYVAVEKHLLQRQGVIDSTATRGPSGFTLDPESTAEIDRLFDRLTMAVGGIGASVAAGQ